MAGVLDQAVSRTVCRMKRVEQIRLRQILTLVGVSRDIHAGTMFDQIRVKLAVGTGGSPQLPQDT